MKKLFSFCDTVAKKVTGYGLLVTAVALVALTSCEDIPMPYEINSTGGSSSTIYSETFSSSLGKWVNTITRGEGGWKASYSTACATGYDNTTQTTTEVTAYLVSPAVSLVEIDSAYVSYDYVLRYNKGDDNQQLLAVAADDYDAALLSGDITTAPWICLNQTHTEGSDYTTFYNVSINLPDTLLGRQVRFALYYNCPASGSTWEVKNFKVIHGLAEESGDDPDDPDTPSIFTQTFSSSLSPFVNYTTSGSGEWVIDYSTAKATGWDGSSTTAGTYYLVSPEINLTGHDTVYVDYTYILRYNKGDENQQLLITDSFDEANPSAGWTVLNNSHTEGSDWATFANTLVQVPSQFTGKKVRIAFYYNTNSTSGSTWEVKSVSLRDGEVPETPDPSEQGGTEDNPFTVAQLQALFDAGSIPSGTVYTLGIVSQVTEISTSFGNATYYISDDGSTDNQFLIYRGYALNGNKFNSEDQLQIGDEVIVTGSVVYYNNKTREYTQGNSLYYSSRLGGTKPTPQRKINVGDEVFENGSFELWTDGVADHWTSASNAFTAKTFAQTSDAHSGGSAISVGQEATSRRIAYEETTLPKGEYKYSFYVKNITEGAEGGKLQAGYGKVIDNGAEKVMDDAQYDQTIDVVPDEWTLVEGSFSLDEKSTVCFIIQNAKKKQIVIDDASLIRTK